MIKNRNVVSVKVVNYSLAVIRSRMPKNRRRARAQKVELDGSRFSMDILNPGIIRKMHCTSCHKGGSNFERS